MRLTRKPHIAWSRYLRRVPCRGDASPFPFSHGRTALTYGARALGLPRGAEVLCPDFICHTVPESLERAGLRVRFYPLGDGLSPEWDALDRVGREDAAALVMVHYFGIPQAARRYRALRERRGWLLIEDNAHGYGAEVDGQLAGTLGDIGFTSPYKSFPIRNGAFLYVSPGVPFEPPLLPCQPEWLAVRVTRAAARRVLDSVPRLRAALRPRPRYISQADFRDEVVQDWAMDRWSHDELLRADLPALRTRRKALYRVWQSFTEARGLKPVFPELAPGAMPLVYPALTGSLAESERWYRWGHRHGIDVHSWPTLPETVVREDGPAMRRWECLVCFPLHQDMDPVWLESALEPLMDAPGSLGALRYSSSLREARLAGRSPAERPRGLTTLRVERAGEVRS